jgi:hypothetical protein
MDIDSLFFKEYIGTKEEFVQYLDEIKDSEEYIKIQDSFVLIHPNQPWRYIDHKSNIVVDLNDYIKLDPSERSMYVPFEESEGGWINDGWIYAHGKFYSALSNNKEILDIIHSLSYWDDSLWE